MFGSPRPVSVRGAPAGETLNLAGRNLIFSEDFQCDQLDPGRWYPHYWWGDDNGSTIKPNDELELYQSDNVLFYDGILRLRAEQETVTGPEGKVFHYTSGMINTGRHCWDDPAPDRLAFQYGYAEIRAKLPTGKGLWPAFWLLPHDQVWPPEIDVMEMVGHDPHTVSMATHWLDENGTHRSAGGKWTGPDFSADWHTFGVDWRPDALIWYVDGVERWRFTDAAHIPAEPMYLVANLAVGGRWAGTPNESTPFPSYFEIAHIKVWSPAP
jgi:beta-glucanase (GH16 family)